MAYIEEKHICYFCEYCCVNIPEQNHISIYPYNNIWICDPESAGLPNFTYCYKFREPCNNLIKNKECQVCLTNKDLIKLPTCSHEICLDCCKTIYFGSSNLQRPKSWEEIQDETSDFHDITAEQYDEYMRYEWHENAEELENSVKNAIENKSLEDLLNIRDNLMSERPEWMNTSYFIEFENKVIKYFHETAIAEKEFENYKKTMTTVENKCCPFCRANI